MKPAASPTFHSFPNLPAEIRLEIYKLAITPRFVHVREGLKVHYDEFLSRFHETAPSHELHPALAHFGHSWRYCLIPEDDRPAGLFPLDYMHTYTPPPQFRLHQSRFTTSKSTLQPWTATEFAPVLPLSWLRTQLLAWHFVRKSYLYSRAPIPPLLHTCAESREALIHDGYGLAFGTRTHGPRTWFHFDRDTLHLNPGQWENPDAEGIYGDLKYESWLMCNSNYNVWQFLPEDLLRVRNLSLRGLNLNSIDPPILSTVDGPGLCSLLRLFGYGVSVLYLVERLLEEDVDVVEVQLWKDCPGRSTERPDERAPMDYTAVIGELIESEREFKERNMSCEP